MKKCFHAKLLGVAAWICAISCAFPFQSCGDPDEPAAIPDKPAVKPDEPDPNPDEPTVKPDEPVIDPDEQLKAEIVGTWISEKSIDVGTQTYSIFSELTFGSNGKVLITMGSAHYENQHLVGQQSTELSPLSYEIKDGTLECWKFGMYEIVPTGDSLTLISDRDNDVRLWPKLIYSHNGESNELYPERLTYTRK